MNFDTTATPNQALQRTPGFGVQLPGAALIRPALSRAVRPAMKPGTARAFALRRRAHTRAPGPQSLSLGSLGVMRTRFLIASLFGLLFHTVGYALDADYSSLPDWQRTILDKTAFELGILPPTALFPSSDAPKDLSTDGFLLFVCSARQNLGKRLLWITAEVEFSNGYKRKFSSVGFHLLAGSSVAIEKLDFPVTPALTIKSLKITSAAVK